jgi:hypothetical protein
MSPSEARAERQRLFGKPGVAGSADYGFLRRYSENDPAALAQLAEIEEALGVERGKQLAETQPPPRGPADPKLAAAVAAARSLRQELMADPGFRAKALSGDADANGQLDRIAQTIADAADAGVR